MFKNVLPLYKIQTIVNASPHLYHPNHLSISPTCLPTHLIISQWPMAGSNILLMPTETFGVLRTWSALLAMLQRRLSGTCSIVIHCSHYKINFRIFDYRNSIHQYSHNFLVGACTEAYTSSKS